MHLWKMLFTSQLRAVRPRRPSWLTMMNWKQVLITGIATGALVALFIVLNSVFEVGFDSLEYFVIYVIGTILLSAYSVKKISVISGYCEPSLKHLIPVAYLTFLIPVLGVSFGAPNSNLVTLATIVMLGAIGGTFWSTPFALWSYYKSRGNQSISGGDLGGNVPDTDQSDE
mgnify:CR=1 FL=1